MTEEAAPAPAPAEKKEKKKPPANLVIPPKKPKLSKAERRALQEQQRAAKAAGQSGGPKPQQLQPQGKPPPQQQQQQKPQQQQSSSSEAPKSSTQNQKANAQSSKNQKEEEKKEETDRDRTTDLFSHLSNYHELPNPHAPEWTSTLHPEVIELGMKYASGTIRGGMARCRAMLEVFLQVFEDYEPPEETTDYRSHLDHNVLKPSFTFWTTKCRQHCVSMGNAFTFCKVAVASLARDLPWKQAKEILQDTLERYMQERMDIANQAITEHALTKITNGDVILTFGNSHAIRVLLTTAKKEGLDFYVWVADSRPLFEGKDMLAALQDAGISCGYIQLNALTFVMKQITKVFLGASALMSNGAIFGRIGTTCVAMLANDSHIPVLVCCETYKISHRVQLESITYNELGNPDTLAELPEGPESSCLTNWKETKNLKLLNLMYDVTPPDFVSGIITEVGIIPSTSIAVLLREMNPQDAAY